MYDCLLGMTARTVPAGAWRSEVVDVARWSSAREGRVGRLRELAGVAAFGLRLRAVEATAARPAAAWSQGATLGSALLLVTALTAQLAEADGPAGAAAATAIATALVAAIAGRPVAAAPLAALALPPAAATGDPWNPVVAALAVSVVAQVLATRAGPVAVRVRVPGGPRVWVGLALVACLLVPAGGAGAVAVVATLVVPAGLVVAGGADARLAVAAAVAWSWRFLAIVPTEVLDALAALRSNELPSLLLRLATMAWAVGLAIVVAHRSARRTSAL